MPSMVKEFGDADSRELGGAWSWPSFDAAFALLSFPFVWLGEWMYVGDLGLGRVFMWGA